MLHFPFYAVRGQSDGMRARFVMQRFARALSGANPMVRGWAVSKLDCCFLFCEQRTCVCVGLG